MQSGKLENMILSFQKLPEEGQDYILGISQALLFAQEHFTEGKTAVKRKKAIKAKPEVLKETKSI